MFSRRNFLRVGGLTLSSFGFAGLGLASPKKETKSKLANMVGDVKPLDPGDFVARQVKAQRLMAEQKLDAIFLEGGSDLRYFTNVRWGLSERLFGVLLRAKGEPVWVCPSFELDRAQERIPKGMDVRTWHEHESPFALVADAVSQQGRKHFRLGVGPRVRSFAQFGLHEAMQAVHMVSASPVTEGCRGIKDAKELVFMDLANRITKLAYQEAFAGLHEGMTTTELVDAIRQAHLDMGVEGGGWPLFGPNAAYPHGTSIKRDLHQGDGVLVDGGCSVEGYRSDVTRTVVLGKPSDRQRQVWDVVRKAQLAAHAAVKPGVTCQDIDAAARKITDDSGFGPDYKLFSHRVGHGIGMDGHEHPYLVRGNTLKLKPGMTFSNEPGIYILGEIGVRIEDCFVVTEDGAKFLGGMESTAIDHPFGA
ncbi:MAG: aminopeptidase P family protein [bacterium]|nr:aminopeptidase P family protein [bacterium]